MSPHAWSARGPEVSHGAPGDGENWRRDAGDEQRGGKENIFALDALIERGKGTAREKVSFTAGT